MPGGEVAITVQVTDAAQQPVAGAEVVLLAVDEAVLALTAYQQPPAQFLPGRPKSMPPRRSATVPARS